MRNDFTPRARFIASPFVDAHRTWAKSDASRAAIEAAISQMAITRKGANLMLLEGVSDFVDILLNISEPTDKPLREDRSALHGQPTTKTPSHA